MGEIARAIVLGLVQGVTEFLPISSSGHLILFRWLVGWDPLPLAFDVSLHLGTLAAVLVYFHHDWRRLTGALLKGARRRQLVGHPDQLLAWLVVIGTLPAAVVGFLTKSYVERISEQPFVIAFFLLLTGLTLFAAQYARGYRQAKDLRTIDAVLIGCAQAAALLPGISRSGSTIFMGVLRGLTPSEAARFSFLLAVPITLGAGLRELPDILVGRGGEMAPLAIILGVMAAAVSAFLSIHYLLKLLATRSLTPFAYYCFALGLGFLAVAILRQ